MQIECSSVACCALEACSHAAFFTGSFGLDEECAPDAERYPALLDFYDGIGLSQRYHTGNRLCDNFVGA